MIRVKYVIAALACTVFLSPMSGYSQSPSEGLTKAEETENVQFFVDWAQFRGTNSKVMLEVYLMIPRMQLEYVKSDSLNKYIAKGFVQVALAQHDSVRLLDRWPISDSEEKIENVKDSQNIPDIAVFEAESGEYELIVQVIDLNSEIRGTFRDTVNLVSFKDSELTISDIEFASLIKKADQKTVFTKYNRDVVPNASMTYGVSTPVLYSYAEIYNMKHPSSIDSFRVQYSILDLNNKMVKSPQEITRRKAGKSSIDIGGLNVVGLSSGIYHYRIRVTDIATGEVATRSKKFYVYKQGEKMQTGLSGGLLADYTTMEEDELDETYKTLIPILTEKERRAFKDASEEGKRNLLSQFWKDRDPDQSTEINESRIEYARRLETVNQRFGNIQTAGYKTDRGRVFLVYGRPDEIERNPVSVDVKPYETWYYHSLQGGSEFVFVDKSGFGIYELVHSTARNELYDPNWRRYIESTGSSYQGY